MGSSLGNINKLIIVVEPSGQGPGRPGAHDHWPSLASQAASSGGFTAPFNTEATSELCLPPVSYEASILVLGHQRNQTEVSKYNPRPTSWGV